jgi:hypothetical protein
VNKLKMSLTSQFLLESLFIYILKQVNLSKFRKKYFTHEEIATKILSAPLRGRNSKFLQLYVVGTLNLCLGTPGTMQKESTQSDYPARRKRPKRGPILLFQNFRKFVTVLSVFSQQGERIKLIPFALCQASLDTSLEYPQHIITRTLNFDPHG